MDKSTEGGRSRLGFQLGFALEMFLTSLSLIYVIYKMGIIVFLSKEIFRSLELACT